MTKLWNARSRPSKLGRRTSIDAVDGTYSLQMFTITRDRGQLEPSAGAGEVSQGVQRHRPGSPDWLSCMPSSGWPPRRGKPSRELPPLDSRRSRRTPCGRAPWRTWARSAPSCRMRTGLPRSTSCSFPRRIAVSSSGAIAVCVGSGSRFLGLLSSLRRRWTEAEGHFEEALAFNDKSGARPALVRTRHDLAAMLLRRRRGDDIGRASEMADLALKDARQMGMAGLGDAARGPRSGRRGASGQAIRLPRWAQRPRVGSPSADR